MAGEILTGAERAKQAKALWANYKGETLTIDDMFAMGAGLSRNQIRTICGAAEEAGLRKLRRGHRRDGVVH